MPRHHCWLMVQRHSPSVVKSLEQVRLGQCLRFEALDWEELAPTSLRLRCAYNVKGAPQNRQK